MVGTGAVTTVKLCVAVRLGVPLSVTTTVKLLVGGNRRGGGDAAEQADTRTAGRGGEAVGQGLRRHITVAADGGET